jgi:hypothetical protein
MSRLATVLSIALTALSIGLQPAAAAGKVVALVIGNEVPDIGLIGSELNAKLKDLKDNLFRYGHESIILEGTNLSHEGLLARIRAFESGLSDAEVAIFYYVGLGAHSRDGDSYLVPQGWDGSRAADLVSIRSVLERMRANDRAKGLVFLDAVQPRTNPGWRVPDIRPGLGGLSREADPEKLQIAFVDVVPGLGSSAALLTGAMVRRLQPDRIKLPQLASQVQQDVSLDTGGMYAPRVFGSVSGSLELQRLSADEFQMKTKRCLDQRRQATEATTASAIAETGTTSADSSDRFCRDYVPPPVDRPRRSPVASKEPASGPAQTKMGASPNRSAVSGAPTP